MIAQASPAAGPLRADPSKRVNYTLGLVLGVDEFQQDQLYHAAGRRGHNRLLHGYGTAWGLAVGRGGAPGDPEIQVEPGVAVDPCGREICVPDRMCVKINGWLERHQPSLKDLFPNPSARPLPLAVVLCHRECPTDTVPVPGEPCRTQEDAMAASRISESFELKLVLRDDAPWLWPDSAAPTGLTVFRLSQPEEQAVRAFGLILARVQSTTDEALGADGEATLLQAIRALKDAADEAVLASPPAPNDDPILLPAATAPDILRRALRVWVTEVRPEIRRHEDPGPCGQDADGECCVLLAEIDLAVTGDWAVSVSQPPIQEDRRPYLLHTRLLQEWLIAAGGEEGRPDVDSWASLQILGPNRIRAWVHHAQWVDVPKDAVSVVVNDTVLAPAQVTDVPYGGIRNVWDVVISQEMSDGDVVELRFDTEKVPVVVGPAAGDTGWTPSGAARTGVTIADELKGPTGEYLDRYGWTLSAFTVYDRIQGGDLEGEYKLPIVVKIQKFPVDPATPLADQYLVSDGAKWLPRYLPDGTKDLKGRYPASIVRGIQGFPVSDNDPVADQYLVFNGTEYVPAYLPDGKQDLEGRYPVSTVTGLQKTPVANTPPGQDHYLFFDKPSGKWIPANLPDATGDLVGRYPSLEIAKLQKKTVSAANPQANQALAFVGGQWVPSGIPALLGPAGGDLDGSYPAPTVVGLRGRALSPAQPQDGDVLVFREGSPPGGQWVPEAITFSPDSDLGGAYPDSRIARLQGRTVDAQNPGPGQVLVYEESSPPGQGRWVPGDLPQDLAFGAAGGDLAGDYPNPTIAALQGRTVDAADPGPGQVLVYEESSPPGNGRWVAADLPDTGGAIAGPAGGDLTSDYPNPRIAQLQGHPVVAVNPQIGQVLRFAPAVEGGGRWVAADLPDPGISGAAGGDLAGDYPNPTLGRLQGKTVSAAAPEPGQVLRFVGSAAGGQWMPADLPDGGTTGPAGGDLVGTYPNPQIAALRGSTLTLTSPQPGQVLTFRRGAAGGTGEWVNAAPPGATGTAGGDLTGSYPNPRIARLQNQALNVGADLVDGHTLVFRVAGGVGQWVNEAAAAGGATGPAAGDLTGTYPNPQVNGLQDVVLKTESRKTDQFLRFTGDAWAPDWAVRAAGDGAYEIIAAGTFVVQQEQVSPLRPPYGKLTATVDPSDRSIVQLSGFEYEVDTYVYVVKGMWEAGVVLLTPPTTTGPRVRLVRFDVADVRGELHLEVSRYPVPTTILSDGTPVDTTRTRG